MVAAPGIIGGIVVKEHIPGVDPSIAQHTPNLRFHWRTSDVDVHLLPVGKESNHPRKDAGNRRKLSGPGGLLVGPAEPGAAVWLPFSRHPVALLGGNHRQRKPKISRGSVE